MFVSDASERNCSSAAAFALPLRGSEGLDAGACEERAERRGVPLTELRFERRCSGEDILKVGFCAVEVSCAVGRALAVCLRWRGCRRRCR